MLDETGNFLIPFKGIDNTKISQIRDFIFLHKIALYVLIDQLPKYYGASASVNSPKTG